MGSAFPPVFILLMLRNRLFTLRNVEMWAVPSCMDFDLLIVRNRVFRFPDVQIWLALSWDFVDLLIFRNCVFKLENVHISTVPNCKGLDLLTQEWHFQSGKRSDKSSTTLQEGRFADAQEKRFQGAKP